MENELLRRQVEKVKTGKDLALLDARVARLADFLLERSELLLAECMSDEEMHTLSTAPTPPRHLKD